MKAHFKTLFLVLPLTVQFLFSQPVIAAPNWVDSKQGCGDAMAGISGIADLARVIKDLKGQTGDSATQEASKDPAPASEQVRIGDLLSTFRHDEHYDVDLKQTEIKDQCSLGTCHIFAFLSEMEQQYLKRTGNPLRLSEDYVVYNHWFMRVMNTLGALEQNVGITFGAYPSQTLFLFRQVGLMPEGVWKPAINYQKNPLADRMIEYMENSMARAVEKAKTVDTLQEKQAILQAELEEILKMLYEAIGDVPDKFIYQGKTYTPRTFARLFFPKIYKPWVRLQVSTQKWNVIDGKGTLRPMITDDKGWVSTYETNIDILEDYVKARLDKGQNVFLAYEHADPYVDMKTGIMAIEAFKAPKGGRVLPRPLRDEYNRGAGGHAVQIVGYELNPRTGRVRKWKIKNSWGLKAGSNGYFHMYASYFREFVMEVLIPNDGDFKDKMPDDDASGDDSNTEPSTLPN